MISRNCHQRNQALVQGLRIGMGHFARVSLDWTGSLVTVKKDILVLTYCQYRKIHKSCSNQVSDILSIQTFAPVWASNTMWTSTTLKNAFPMNLFQILFSSITCIFMTISLSLFQFTQLSNSIESQPLTGRWLNSLKSTQTNTKSLFILVIGGIYKFIK